MTVKNTAHALAALFALSGGAMAAQSTKAKTKPAPTCTQATTELDCAPTGSLEKVTKPATTTTQPKLGIDVNPWIMPGSF
jgi:hypothetical protein